MESYSEQNLDAQEESLGEVPNTEIPPASSPTTYCEEQHVVITPGFLSGSVVVPLDSTLNSDSNTEGGSKNGSENESDESTASEWVELQLDLRASQSAPEYFRGAKLDIVNESEDESGQIAIYEDPEGQLPLDIDKLLPGDTFFPTQPLSIYLRGEVAGSLRLRLTMPENLGMHFQAGPPAEISVVVGAEGQILSTLALDQITAFAKLRNHRFFHVWMAEHFGFDVSPQKYFALHAALRKGEIEAPPILVQKDEVLDGHLGAYNRSLAVIEVAKSVAEKAAEGDPGANWTLVAILVEEFGHFLDEWLRDGQGDAPNDEGAMLGYALLNLGWNQQSCYAYAQYIPARPLAA